MLVRIFGDRSNNFAENFHLVNLSYNLYKNLAFPNFAMKSC